MLDLIEAVKATEEEVAAQDFVHAVSGVRPVSLNIAAEVKVSISKVLYSCGQ